MAQRPSRVAELEEAHRCLSFALRRAMRSVTRRYDAEFRATGLRGTQFTLLVLLDDSGPITTTALASRMALERSTVSRNVALLAAGGMVRIEAGDDARTRLVSITTRGRQAARRALPAWRKAHAAMRVLLGGATFDDLIRRLEIIERASAARGSGRGRGD
jgi:DNA-binding MarR family transcriptional regulator